MCFISFTEISLEIAPAISRTTFCEMVRKPNNYPSALRGYTACRLISLTVRVLLESARCKSSTASAVILTMECSFVKSYRRPEGSAGPFLSILSSPRVMPTLPTIPQCLWKGRPSLPKSVLLVPRKTTKSRVNLQHSFTAERKVIYDFWVFWGRSHLPKFSILYVSPK